MLFPQSRAQAFGPVLRDEIGNPANTHISIATAWVRASGLVQIQDVVLNAIANGASISFVVGIDAENTSIEGLQGLLNLIERGGPGQISAVVRHNEAGPLFHPKLYAFHRGDGVRTYVGSNNLTQSGLFLNDELSALLVGPAGGELDRQLADLMGALTNLGDPLNRTLDQALLKALVEGGYVFAEKRLAATARARSYLTRVRKALFGSEKRAAPKRAMPADAPVPAKDIDPVGVALRPGWQAAYLRVRLARGTQAQIPIRVAREIYLRMGADPDQPLIATERTSGEERAISPARARGTINTYKFEAAEANGEPLLAFSAVGDKLFYEFLDSADPVGSEVMRLLEAGFDMDPPRTHSSVEDREHATWFRFE